jgi:TolB-like protein/DNA-binding winged helix-turn-helix (wHTH) protein/tetratricopeptide (TPR) repeat protein
MLACTSQQASAMMNQEHTGRLWVGDWLVDPALDQIMRASELVKLEPRTMRLLLRLASAPGQVVTSQQLLDDVWSKVVVGSASVYQAISQLRKLLGDTDSTPSYIATVPRKGYRLVAAVRSESNTPNLARRAGDVIGSELAVALVETPAAQPRISNRRSMMVVAVVIIAAAGLTTLLARGRGDSLPYQNSIVVLPFVDMTKEGIDTPLCDGLSEELSTSLAQLPALRVIARTSAFSFRGRSVDVREIGRALSATHVLEGSVRRSGNQVRVTAQLIDARDGTHRWAQTYDVASNDALQIQHDVAQSVATALKIQFPQTASVRIASRGTTDRQAYALYLSARHYYRERTAESNAQAIDLYQQAIRLDPRYALAYVGLAQARLNEVAVAQRPLAAATADIEPLLNTALSLTPNLAEAFAVRGQLRAAQDRFDEALKDLRHALQLGSNNAEILVSMGRVLESRGDLRESLASYDHAAQLDPLDFMRQVDRCIALQDLGQFDAAAVACERARTLQPDSPWVFIAASWLEKARGDLDQALVMNARAIRLDPQNTVVSLERVDDLLDLGLTVQARQALQRSLDASSEDMSARIRVADILFMTQGIAAAREYLERLPLEKLDSPADRVLAAQALLGVGADHRAQVLLDQVQSAPDISALQAAHVGTVKWGLSYLLPLALSEKRRGNITASHQHVQDLLALIDRMQREGYANGALYAARADALAIRGDLEAAMTALRLANDHGWRSTWSARIDPYLAGLFDRPDFTQLMRAIEQRNAPLVARYRENESLSASTTSDPIVR